MSGIKSAKIVGKVLTLEIELDDPRPSASGKTRVVATTGGFTPTGVNINGQPIKANVTLTIPRE